MMGVGPFRGIGKIIRQSGERKDKGRGRKGQEGEILAGGKNFKKRKEEPAPPPGKERKDIALSLRNSCLQGKGKEGKPRDEISHMVNPKVGKLPRERWGGIRRRGQGEDFEW